MMNEIYSNNSVDVVVPAHSVLQLNEIFPVTYYFPEIGEDIIITDKRVKVNNIINVSGVIDGVKIMQAINSFASIIVTEINGNFEIILEDTNKKGKDALIFMPHRSDTTPIFPHWLYLKSTNLSRYFTYIIVCDPEELLPMQVVKTRFWINNFTYQMGNIYVDGVKQNNNSKTLE